MTPAVSSPWKLLTERLLRLTRGATDLWETYQQEGPGRVDPALFDSVKNESDAIGILLQSITTPKTTVAWLGKPVDEWHNAVSGAVHTICDLAHQCACTPQGLCFITGESGLIPRHDLHAKFDESLQFLREQCDWLESIEKMWHRMPNRTARVPAKRETS